MINTEVCIPGYKINDELYNGSRTLVYRGYRESDSLPVVIKLLKNAYPSFSELVQFRNQYTISKNLNYPAIIQTYSLEAYHNGYVLVMEDFGGISLKDYFNDLKTLNKTSLLTEFLQFAISLCDILEILYQQRIIHKDIKPANILINPENKQVKLIDFSIASLLNKETQEIKNPNILEGTLAYLSPEQTGRMNRGIDYRSDFYSLGITFYELLTGELPFVSDDAMELVHCHIAKQPASVNSEEIPQVLNDIVIKLMAKNAEDRYQSALGLKHDLENCLHQIKDTGKVTGFQIAQRDICDRFIIPDKLYGRDKEVEQLLEAFERVSSGNSEMMLVAGFSGIGKTAVINEVHKPIVKQRGYFIKGKFDQFNRNIPLDAFVQAFRDLMKQLIAESDTQIQEWKSKILEALGENGQVIIDVIPELEKIIGNQPSVTELSGNAAQNRFNLLFQNFIQVFTKQEHPLVIFLDDLQWADLASLTLIKLLMNDSGYFMMLGAYRDNEVSPAHPFILTVEEVQKKEKIVNTITLAPLAFEDTNHLVADTLNCSRKLAQPLTELIARKTQGNPFFTTQFLKSLHQDKLINFNSFSHHWECDITQINALSLTDDVVEFMVLQLQKLPQSTQNILKLAACIGNQFDLETLAIVSEQSPTDTAKALWKALQEDLILPTNQIYKFFQGTEQSQIENNINPNYRFLHDRVQQAAYSLIREEQKQTTHYHIGKLLLQKIPLELREERIFELVNQLNYGINLIVEQSERDELAQLNLIACRKAKSATAYKAGSEYGNIGLSLLGENSWKNQYEITLELHNLAAELASLRGDWEAMEYFIEEVIQQAPSLLVMVNVCGIRIQANVSQNKFTEAIAIGKEFLQELGITFPETVTPENIQSSITEISQLIGNREIKDLVNLPLMVDEKKLAILQITSNLFSAAYLSGSPLYPLLVTLCVKLSIQYGNTSVSPYAYVAYGLLSCIILKDINTGIKFGDLALQVVSKLDAKANRPEVLLLLGLTIVSRKFHIKETLPLFQEGYAIALEVGNLEFAGHNIQNFCLNSFWCAQPLPSLEQIFRTYSNVLVQLNQSTTANYCHIYWQTILNLQGVTKHPTLLSGEALQEADFLLRLKSLNDGYGAYIFYLCKLMLCFLFGEIEPSHAIQVRKYFIAGAGFICEPGFYFYDSLTALAGINSHSKDSSEIFKQVEQNQTQLQQLWASYAPMNYQHKFDLVEAEKYRVLGKNYEAGDFYDRAIYGAKENGYIQEEAIANELAAKFYLDWDKEKIASGYMQEAYYCYSRWGAKAKIDDLEKRYPNLLQPILQQQRISFNPSETISFRATSSSTRTSNSTSTTISDILDFTSILKAAQTISSNIELDQLITNLTKIILENSGAKKSVLILPKKDNWQVQAINFTNPQNNSQKEIQTILNPQSIDSCQDIPIKIINYVKNTQKSVVIDNCQTEIPAIIGEYMLSHQPKSILCTPIIDRGNLIAILYLENKLTSGVFTKERLQVINLLSSQAAISLENARLYQQAQQAQLQIVQSEKMSALGNLVAGVAHEMNNPLGFINASLKQTKPTIADITEHLKLYQENLPNPDEEILEHAEDIDLDYSLEDLPKVLDSMVMACDRLKNISTSLRTFSRADKDYKVAFNIHQGIDSTILILKHRLKANDKRPAIEVITDYGDLPQIECFPGQLNQVFMNILANAIDALEDFNTGRTFEEIKAKPNQITVKTLLANNSVKIKIADNGKGMSEETKNKIFDHLFTTKEVGKGTGLGLAIAKQIIEEKHGGKLSCNSILGEGTEFVIEIPV